MKLNKKIATLSLVAALAATTIIGGTMAYFTDTDSEDNVFTTGNVDIELVENFEQNSKLIPATGSAQNGTLENGVTKEVSVKNVGTEDAYVRVHIAIPNVLDNGDPTFDASNNVLHFNYATDSIGVGKWDWSNSTGAPYEGNWNYYEKNIDGIDYNVYVVTYESKLATGVETPEKAMHQVYLDSKVTNDDITKMKEVLGDEWEIKVVAEGTQAAGFDDAYEALNTAFGTPGTYNPWE
ncbi:TasA family protein [Clostridium sp.]|uniref:TasA family protein n=1 Tax=Clostridium sp. TaxID=1506 RepID=UPI002910CFB0|nr:TasA family protein [Clostridium sp.]MDU5106875.1 TasA family protein [Clostridium sp.]